MGQLSIWHWLIVVIFVLPVIPAARILKRIGLNQWLAIFYVVPVVGYFGLWLLAFSPWPDDRRAPSNG